MRKNMVFTRDCFKTVLRRALYSTSFIIISALYPLINRYTGRERNLTLFIDRIIPFDRYFILPYVFWYIYLGVFLIYFCFFDERKYVKIIIAINSGMIISYLMYLIFPTTVPRPVFDAGDGLIGRLFEWLYSKDNPYNCFPSLHVLDTLLIAFYVQKDNLHLNKFIKTLSWICAAAIIYSTFAIKQHVVLDAVSAAAVAYGLYAVMEYSRLFSSHKRRQSLYEMQ